MTEMSHQKMIEMSQRKEQIPGAQSVGSGSP